MRSLRPYMRIACLAAYLALLVLAGCSDSPDEKAGAGKGIAKGPPPVPAQIHGPASAVILVNDLPAARLTLDLPVWITCVIDNPGPKPLTWEKAGLTAPHLTTATGADTVATWRAVAAKTKQTPANGNLVLHWIMKGSLAPGSYRVEMKRKDQTSGLAVRSASLEITSGKGAATEASRIQRRLLALEGRNAELLSQLNAQLAKNPGNHNLRMEQVEALAATGKRGEARKKLAGLIKALQDAQEKASPDKPPHIPYWMVQYLRLLQAKETKPAN